MAGLRPVKLFAIALALATGCLTSASDPSFAQTQPAANGPPPPAVPAPPATSAQPPPAASAPAPSDAILLTIFLRHDQSKTLDEINDHLRKTGWYDKFPPPGVEIVSWYV